jgi:TP901 family phage tail tape measure protein
MLNNSKLSAISGEIGKIANPKFDWNPGLRQMDDLTKSIQKGKLSIGEYFKQWRTGVDDIASHQERLSRSVATPIGTKGAMAMTIPSAASIAPTVTAMEKMNRQFAVQSELLSGMGTKIQDWGKNTQWAGRQMMVGFTVPFAMAAAAAGKYAMDIDKALTRIEKVYDGSTKGLREQAVSVATDITKSLGVTVQSSLEIMGELAAAGKQGAQMFELTAQAQRLSVLGDVDKEESIKAVISLSTIYGLTTKELAASIDYLNAVDAKTPTSMKDLADAIPIAGATVKQLGGDLKDTTVLLSAFKERGISTVEGANAIKSAMNRVLVPTAAAKSLFKEFVHQDLETVVASKKGDPLDTMQAISDAVMGGNVALEDQQKIISKLFGTYQSTRITGLLQGLQQSNGAVAETKKLSEQSDGELRDIAEKHRLAIVNSASRQFTIAVESFKTELKSFGDFALQIATVAIQAFGKIFNLFNSMPGPLKAIVIGVALLAAVAGPIVMLAGLFGNLFGSVIKFAGFLTGLRKGYNSMTIDQKAAQLAANGMTNSMMKESEAAQILIVQMGKLLGAIQAVDVAQAKAVATPGVLGGGMAVLPNQTRAVQNPVTGSWRTNTGKDVSADEAVLLNKQQKDLTAEKEKTAKAETQVAEEVKKTSLAQRAFSTESLVGVGAVAGIASMAAESGSNMERWLTWISLGSVALSAIIPIVTKIGTVVAGMDMFKALTGGGGLTSKLGDLGAKIGSSIKSGFSAAISFMKTPMGIGIGVATLAVLGITKLVSAEADRLQEKHQQILRSTDDWTKALGRTKVEWGQIKNEAGQVEDTVASMAEKMKTDNAPMVDRFKNVSDPKELQWMANTQVGNLQGQGLNQKETMDAMEALLRAAGKTREEILKILSNIRVSFDFTNGEQDFEGFIAAIKKKAAALQTNLFSDKATQFDSAGTASISGDALQNLNRETEELAQQFKDRIANMSDVDRAVFAKKFADQMAQGYSAGFQTLNSEYGGKLGKDWADARQKFMEFNKDDGTWQLNDAGKTQLDTSAGQKLTYLAKEESDLAKAIAKANGASDDQLKHISVMGDIMPSLSQGVGDATKTQNAFNKAVEAYEKGSGRKMTDVEKLKMAAVYASVSGLTAAVLVTNGYSNANMASAQAAEANARGIQTLIGGLKEAATAGKDMWDNIADPGGGGFDALGGDAAAQAQKLTDVQKGIFSGTMNNVYDAYASSAEETWKNRLDNITKAFESKKEALQKQMTDFDKAYDQKQQAFGDRWDATMESTKQSFADRQKAIEDQATAQIDSIDNQIQAIQDQKAAEAELENARQKQFEAEKQRIERMTTLANNRIAYSRAIGGGNLDEAARVQNNSESVSLGWSIDDANSRASDKAAAKDKLSDQQIKELNSTKDLIQKQKQAKLDALKEEEDAVTKSLEKQREAEKRSMETARDIEKERLQNRLDGLAKEQSAAEDKERKVQEMNKRTLDIQLATLKAFIPQNEAQLNDHINRVGGAYGQFGLGLQGAGSMWGQIVGNALQNNVDIARNQMSSDANWGAFGAQVAGAIAQGAFGLNLNDFMNLLRTGNPPAGWAPPGVQTIQQRSSDAIHYRHTGGLVDDTLGSRAGIGGDGLHPSEMPIVAQRGEFVINKDAVQRLGTQNLTRINAGDPKAISSGVSVAGYGGGFAGIMGRAMTQIAVNNLAAHYAAENSKVAAALGFDTGSGTGAAVDFAKAQDGKPYIWGGVGPAGYDCSGYMSAIANVLTGKSPHNRLFSTGMVQNGKAFGPFVPGLGGKFQIGVSNGHTAGTLMGTNVESTGNHVRYGKDAHGATDKQFNLRFHVPDDKVVEGAAAWSGGPVDESNLSRLIVQIGKNRGFSRKGAEVALITAIVESGIRNLNYGDRDSLGIFQQRPSQGWGTPAQIMDPNYSTNKFYSALAGVKGWEGMLEGTAAQRVQRSAYPDRYQTKLGQAISLVNQSGFYDAGGDILPGNTLVKNATNQVETVVTFDTRNALIGALEKANVTYSGFADILKTAIVPGSVAPGFDTGPSNTYTYEVNINGSSLSANELKRVVSDAIDEKHMKTQKKLGKIK